MLSVKRNAIPAVSQAVSRQQLATETRGIPSVHRAQGSFVPVLRLPLIIIIFPILHIHSRNIKLGGKSVN